MSEGIAVGPLWECLEFFGRGDPFFGGNADDHVLRTNEGGVHEFTSSAAACRRSLQAALFRSEEEALAAGRTATTRNGLISAHPAMPRVAP